MDAWRHNFQEQNQKSFSKIQKLRQAIAIVQNDNQQILSKLEPYEKWMDDAYDYIARYQHSDSGCDYEEEDTSDSKIDDDDSNFDFSDDQNSQSRKRGSCITNNRQLLPNSQPSHIPPAFASLHHVEQASTLNQVTSQPNTHPSATNSENQKKVKDPNNNVYYIPTILIPAFCFIPQQESTTVNQDEAVKTNEEPVSNQKDTVESITSKSNGSPPLLTSTATQENNKQLFSFLPVTQNLETPSSLVQTKMTTQSQNDHSRPMLFHQSHPSPISQPRLFTQNAQTQVAQIPAKITSKSQNNDSKPMQFHQKPQTPLLEPQTNITPKSHNNISQPAPLYQNHQAQISQPQTNMTSKSVDDNSQRMMFQQPSKKRAEESIHPPDLTNYLEMANPARLFQAVSQDPRLGSVHSNATKNIPSVIIPSSKSDIQLSKQSVQSYPPTASTTVTNTNQNATPTSNQTQQPIPHYETKAAQNYKMIQVNQNLSPGKYLLSIPILLSTKTSINSHQILQILGQTTQALHHFLSQSPEFSVQLPLNNQFSVIKMDSMLPRADNQAAHIRTPQNDTSQPMHQSLYKSQDPVNSPPTNQPNLKNNYPVYSAISNQNPQHQTNPQMEPPASQQHVLENKEQIKAIFIKQSNGQNIHVGPSTVPPSIPRNRINRESTYSSNQHAELLKKDGIPASTAKQFNGQSNVHKAPANSLMIPQKQESDAFLMESQNQSAPKPNYNFIHPLPFKDIIASQNRDLPTLKQNPQASSSQNDKSEILRRYLVDILSQIENQKEGATNFINQLNTSNSSFPPKE